MAAREIDRARRHQESFVDELQDAPRQSRREVRPKIQRAILLDPPREIDARILLRRREFYVGIGFVVAQYHIELRAVFLDQIVFERERFASIADENRFQIRYLSRERSCLGIDPARLEKIGTYAAAQRCRFADIE